MTQWIPVIEGKLAIPLPETISAYPVEALSSVPETIAIRLREEITIRAVPQVEHALRDLSPKG
jgi:hypothetical protein